MVFLFTFVFVLMFNNSSFWHGQQFMYSAPSAKSGTKSLCPFNGHLLRTSVPDFLHSAVNRFFIVLDFQKILLSGRLASNVNFGATFANWSGDQFVRDSRHPFSPRDESVADEWSSKYNCERTKTSPPWRHSGARPNRCRGGEGVLSEMGKACFSKWRREKGAKKDVSSMTIVHFRWFNSADRGTVDPGRGLSFWWMWDLSGFLNYLARLLKRPLPAEFWQF